MKVFESDYVKIEYSPEVSAVHLTWLRYVKGDDFKTGLEKALAAAQQYQARGWIGDVQLLGVVDEADTKWVNTDWFPRLLGKSSVSRMAVVVGPRAVTKMSVGAIMQKVSDRLTNRNCGSVQEARDWLLGEFKKAA